MLNKNISLIMTSSNTSNFLGIDSFSITRKYNSIHPSIRKQIKKLCKNTGISSGIKESKKLRKISKDGNKKLQKKLEKMHIRYNVYKQHRHQLLKLIQKKEYVLNGLECFNPTTGEIIKFKSIINTGSHVQVLLGDKNGQDVVVKFYEKRDSRGKVRKNMQYEIDIYKRLQDMNAKMPNFYEGFYFWSEPVLVMEKLYPLDTSDDEFEVARQVMPQLKLLHPWACHSDLKPLNIMKRYNPSHPSNKEYLIIDFGGITMKRLPNGMYERTTLTPSYTAQKRNSRGITPTSAKYDFIELGHTIKGLQNKVLGIKGRARFGEKKYDPIRSGFTGKLAKFMEKAKSLDEIHVSDRDYDEMLRILNS